MQRVNDYFPYGLQVSRETWDGLGLGHVRAELLGLGPVPDLVFVRHVASLLNRRPECAGHPAQARLMNLHVLMTQVFRHVIDVYAGSQHPGVLDRALDDARQRTSADQVVAALEGVVRYFPPAPVVDGVEWPECWLQADEPGTPRRDRLLREALILRVAAENPALDDFREVLDDRDLAASTPYLEVARSVEDRLRREPAPGPAGMNLPDFLRAPMRAAPHSLLAQVEYIRQHWATLLPPDMLDEIRVAFDVVREEERQWWSPGDGGPPAVLDFASRAWSPRHHGPDPEAFSRDADWMPNVVLIAKMVYVWLDQLSKRYGRPIQRLDQIPGEELDRLAAWGFTGLWLIGVWERSSASQRIKQLAGNPDALSSAYALYDYRIADDLGGEDALAHLREETRRRGIRLASDMVPNHTGIYSQWTVDHPDWYVQLDYPPYPVYTFNGPDLSPDPRVGLFIEDGYWERRDAAVVFKHVDRATGRVRFIYHGNDGTSTPWNDTAQLDYMQPQVREAVMQAILGVARRFPIIRFDAAMTLAKLHYQRLWYPAPGQADGVPSRAGRGMTDAEFDAAFPAEFWREVVDRVAAEAPDTLLLAEAFWLMEGYFVRTLGMHRVYNSAFMNMLKLEDNGKYRQTLKNVLEFEPQILQRFVNFMNNPDERTAVEQFGREGKYLGTALMLVTLPGLPMFGHGQVEGFTEKYGMEYKRAYRDETPDAGLIAAHEARVFPLMRRRPLFSGAENFALYDFFAGDAVNEDVFAYSNRAGEERGLILFHNKFASTAGWVRTSTGIARKDASGGTAVAPSTLAEALALNGDGRTYYVFRDWLAGLEYLRSGRELVERGLHVDLGAYDCRAFLDWREIRDDDFGTWGRLREMLGDGGVGSVDEEVKGVRFGEVHQRLAEVVTVAAARVAEVPAQGRAVGAGPVLGAARALVDALDRHGSGAGDPDLRAVAMTASFEALRGLVHRAPAPSETTKAPAGPLQDALADPRVRRVALAGIALQHAGAMASRGHELGLGRPLDGCGANGVHVEAGRLLPVVLEHAGLFADPGLDVRPGIAGLLGDAGARAALRVHEAGGIEWLHRESLEEVATLIAVLAAVTPAADGRFPGAAAVAAIGTALKRLLDGAGRAGYRVDALPGNLKPPKVRTAPRPRRGEGGRSTPSRPRPAAPAKRPSRAR